MSERETMDALRYVFEVADLHGIKLGEYHASTDCVAQIKEYKCFGCAAVAHTNWPNWVLTFKHEENCRYLAARRALKGEQP